MAENSKYDGGLPEVAAHYIDAVVKKVRYRKKVRGEVRSELVDHFMEALSGCDSYGEKERAAKEVISEFGDVKILAGLIRRGKKRCRPLWKKVLVRVMGAFGVLILLTLVRVGYLAAGVATVSVNYAAVLGEIDRQGKDESLNSKPYYDEAIELMVDVPESIKSVSDGGALDEVSSSDVEAYLIDMAPAFEALREGSGKPYYWSEYYVSGEVSSTTEFVSEIIGSQMGFFGPYKRLVQRMHFYQIPWHLQKGNAQAALEDSIALIRFGRHLSGRGLLIEQLVGIAIEAMGLESIKKLLDKEHLSFDDLALLQEELKVRIEDDWPITLEAEKVLWMDLIQRGFTDDGSGNGRVILKGVLFVTGDNKNGFLFGYPDRREFTESIESIFAEADNIIRTVPWQLENGGIDKLESPAFDDVSVMLKIVLQAFTKVGKTAWGLQTNKEAYIVVCAVLRYRERNERLPESLGELVDAGLLDDVSIDPYSGKSMVYRKTDDGFILYSVGENRIDNGGKSGAGENGDHILWTEKGDWVFWPVDAEGRN